MNTYEVQIRNRNKEIIYKTVKADSIPEAIKTAEKQYKAIVLDVLKIPSVDAEPYAEPFLQSA